jgi:hypothetical protein
MQNIVLEDSSGQQKGRRLGPWKFQRIPARTQPPRRRG